MTEQPEPGAIPEPPVPPQPAAPTWEPAAPPVPGPPPSPPSAAPQMPAPQMPAPQMPAPPMPAAAPPPHYQAPLRPTEPSATTPGPQWQSPPPRPPQPFENRQPPGPGAPTPSTASTGLDKIFLLGAAFVALIATVVIGIAASRTSDSQTTAYAIAMGSVLFFGLMAFIVWRLGSPNAAAATLLAVSAIALVGGVSVISDNDATPVDTAVDTSINPAAAGNDPVAATTAPDPTATAVPPTPRPESTSIAVGPTPGNSITSGEFRSTAAEERCFIDEGITLRDTITADSDTSAAGAETQNRILNALLICAPRVVDNEVWIEDFRVSFSSGLGAEATTGEIKCMVRYAIDNSDQPAQVLAGIDIDTLREAAEACFTDELMATLRGDAGTGPQNYGDDADFDLLYDQCSLGRDTACDLLYDRASIDSEYLLHAEDCAGRGLNSEYYCTPGINDIELDGYGDASSPGWQKIEDDCIAGDMFACDFAFNTAELSTDTVRLGETCGNRLAASMAECHIEFSELVGG